MGLAVRTLRWARGGRRVVRGMREDLEQGGCASSSVTPSTSMCATSGAIRATASSMVQRTVWVEEGQPSQLPRSLSRSVGPSAASRSSPATSTSPACEPR